MFSIFVSPGAIVATTIALGAVALAMTAPAPVRAAAAEPAVHPGRPGLLVIEAAADSSRFRWAPMGEDGSRALVWDGGSLFLPPGVECGSLGPTSLTLRYGVGLAGVADGRRLLFEPGRYPVDSPLLLTDGRFHLNVHRGEIVIAAGRIRYVDSAGADPRAQYLLLAGVALLTFIMLARTRARLRRS